MEKTRFQTTFEVRGFSFQISQFIQSKTQNSTDLTFQQPIRKKKPRQSLVNIAKYLKPHLKNE